MHISPVDSDRLAYSEKSTSQKNTCHEKQDGRFNENSLPSISKSSLKKIRAHEFVNFDLLLSQSLNSPAYSDSQVACIINFSGKTGLSLHASGPPKQTVVDLLSFLEAWNVYLQATLVHHPSMLNKLLGYQKIICQYAARYKPQAWLAYDKECQQACAVNKSLKWDTRNED